MTPLKFNFGLVLLITLMSASCVSTKQYSALETRLKNQNLENEDKLNNCTAEIRGLTSQLNTAVISGEKSKQEIEGYKNTVQLRQEQIKDLKLQIEDIRGQRDKQVTQVGDLTVLSQSASNNIKETLSQLESKDKYIRYVQAARTKADSINLVLALNLKSVLKDGIEDNDIEIKVDKTVVFINLSDKMLYHSGSAIITPRASEVLGKIAQIVSSRPSLEVMVEGYTDNMPINNTCVTDNWDLSVKRATSVVRVLQKNYGIDPNSLIAAGRGEYNTLVSNDTFEGRAQNRRTRIIILPKLNQFYDLLNPSSVPK